MRGLSLTAVWAVVACGGQMSQMSQVSQMKEGRIVYQSTMVPNPSYQGGGGVNGPYSDALRALVLRDNVAAQRIVSFDGRRSRVEEVNFDYGVKSPALRLREAGRGVTVYCKEFPHLGFCVEQPDALVPGGPAPIVELTEETGTVAGFPCRRATYDNLSRKVELYFTDQVEAEDQTGAVHHIDGVPGLILQWQPIDDVLAARVERVTVVDLSFTAPDPSLFAPPAGYRMLASVDEARAEERRLLDAEAAQYPVTEEERARFVGRFRLATAPDELHVEIIPDGAGYLFRTTLLGDTSEERAMLKSHLLVVEGSPNSRLYRLSDDHEQLFLVGSEAFRFRRVH